MLSLDAPPTAIALWLEGDQWVIRFPDHQRIEIPAGATQRLQSILLARAGMKLKAKISEPGLPTQEILDRWKEKDDPAFEKETREEMEEKAGARRRAEQERKKVGEEKRKVKDREERRKLALAAELLAEIGL